MTLVILYVCLVTFLLTLRPRRHLAFIAHGAHASRAVRDAASPMRRKTPKTLARDELRKNQDVVRTDD
jgi:hypothetical protein